MRLTSVDARYALVTLVAVAALTCCDGPASETSGSAQRLARFTAAGMTVDYPASWRVQTSKYGVSTMSTLLGYMSTDAMHDPCTVTTNASGTTTNCGLPLERLSARGVLLRWSQDGAPGLTLEQQPGTAQTIDGRAAHVAETAAGGWCAGIGGSKEIHQAVEIGEVPSHEGLLTADACLAPRAARPDVVAALASLHLHS